MAKKTPADIAILGAGSWGTAIAVALARNGHNITLWSRDPDDMAAIRLKHENAHYLPSIKLSPLIQAETKLRDAVKNASYIILAIPSYAVADVFAQIPEQIIRGPAAFIIAAKGIDPHSGLLLPDLLHQIHGDDRKIALLAGPTFAKEVALDMPTAITIASKDHDLAIAIAALFHQDNLRPYLGHDLIGAALGGTIKNVIAIAVGISDGLGYGANARSALITRGLAEMLRLGKAIGANPETLFGLAGVGDLVLTCTDNQSRNRRFGLLLGQGILADQAVAQIGQAVEGMGNAIEVMKMAEKYKIEMPITQLVCAVLKEGLAAINAVELLLARNIREEAI